MSFELPGVKRDGDIERLFRAIGFVVVQWGHAEQTLDLLVIAIFHRFNGHQLLKRRPQHLEPKIKFLRDSFSSFAELAGFKEECDDLLTKFSTIGKRRNDIVHGAITSTSCENGAFTLLKIDVKPKEYHRARPVFLDDSEWTEFRNDLMRLGKDGVSLAQRVWDVLK